MDRRRSVSLDEVDLVAVPFEQVADLVVGGTTEHGGVGNLVAVEVQYRQDRSVARRVEEADGLPEPSRTGLGLAVADYGGNEEVWVVECGTEGVGEDVAELTALVDRAGVGTLTWLGTPPGVENCLKSRRIPATSCETSG